MADAVNLSLNTTKGHLLSAYEDRVYGMGLAFNGAGRQHKRAGGNYDWTVDDTQLY